MNISFDGTNGLTENLNHSSYKNMNIVLVNKLIKYVIKQSCDFYCKNSEKLISEWHATCWRIEFQFFIFIKKHFALTLNLGYLLISIHLVFYS